MNSVTTTTASKEDIEGKAFRVANIVSFLYTAVKIQAKNIRVVQIFRNLNQYSFKIMKILGYVEVTEPYFKVEVQGYLNNEYVIIRRWSMKRALNFQRLSSDRYTVLCSGEYSLGN